jgi:hypothetical protein
MRRLAVLIGVLSLAAAAGTGCGGGSMSTGAAGTTGSAGSGAGTAGSGGTTGGGGTTGNAGTGGGGPFLNVGVCGWRGEATASATAFDGFEERFILSDEGLGAAVCVVRYAFKKVAGMTPPGGCTECEWTHVVEYSAPTVMTDTNGACANSELAFNTTKIQSYVGMRMSMGFARELGGAHGSAMMKYDTAMAKWDVFGNATFDPTSGLFRHDYRDGICNYR